MHASTRQSLIQAIERAFAASLGLLLESLKGMRPN
jgi:hypothetical protein